MSGGSQNVSSSAAVATTLSNTSTVHIPGLGQVQILNMAPQVASNVQCLPAGTQILSPGTQFQTSAGQFATAAAAIAQPAMQQALQQDPQDPTKWHVVQVATAPAALAAAAPGALQAAPEAAVPATHTAQLVTTVSASSSSIAPNNDRNGKEHIIRYFVQRTLTYFAKRILSCF